MASRPLPQCPFCLRRHATRLAAAACCSLAPKEPVGWCAWCGRDCSTAFCCQPCAVAYRRDVVAEQRSHAA